MLNGDQDQNRAAYQSAVKAQADASNPVTSAWVSANAGSGKTKVLIDRVARLLLEGAKPDSILCLTYTRAAANEMLSRFFETLGEWSILSQSDLSTKLAKLEGKEQPEYSSEKLRRARALFATALETPGGLRIETIHSFCGRVLQRFPAEAGIAPQFETIDEKDAEKLWKKASDEAIIAAPDDALDCLVEACGGLGAFAGLNKLKNNATDVLYFAKAHAMVVPSGEKIDRLSVLDGHYGVSRVIGGTKVVDYASIRTQLNKVMEAPEQSIEEYLTQSMRIDFPVNELKDVAKKLELGKKIDTQTSQRLWLALDTNNLLERWEIYRSVFTTGAGAWRASNPYTAMFAGSEISDLLQIKGETQGTELLRVLEVDRDIRAIKTVERTWALLRVGIPALLQYELEKKQTASLDFGDLIQRTRVLLENHEAREWVHYKLDGGIQHVLVDEAQDNSPDQWKLVRKLTEEFFAGTDRDRFPKARTLFTVGDEKQSIYAFQGADPEQFKSNKQDYRERAEKFESPKMEMSFRSSPEILSFVDEVFGRNLFPDSSPFSVEPDEGELHHDAHRYEQPGCVELWDIVSPKEESDDSIPWEAPLDFEGAKSPKTMLVQDLAEAVKQMIESGEQVWARQPDNQWKKRPMQYQDILILVRNRVGGLFDSIIRALKDRNLPVAGADRLTLTNHIGVQDCLNLMRFALLPEDDLTLAEILRGPFCDLVDDDNHLFPLAYDRNGQSLWSRLIEKRDDARFAKAYAFCSWLIAMKNEPPFEFLSSVLETPFDGSSDGWQNLARRLGAPAREPLEELLNRAAKHDEEQASGLQSFVAEMDKDSSQVKRELSAPDGEIRVMTCHGAKGLQAPVVILPDTTSAASTTGSELMMYSEGDDEEYKIPLWATNKKSDVGVTEIIRENLNERALREHRRLLYVALTRPQDRLIICGAWYGSKKSKTGYGKNCWYEHCMKAMEEKKISSIPKTLLNTKSAMFIGTPDNSEKSETREETSVLEEENVPSWLNANLDQGSKEVSTQTQGASTLRDAPVLVPFSGKQRTRGLNRGNAIHNLLEILPSIPVEERLGVAKMRVRKMKHFNDDEKEKIVSSTLEVLEHPTFAEVFAPDGRAEAPIIGSVEGLSGRMINGRVDRLVVREDIVHIIDFKTNRNPPKDESDVPLSYLVQMATYRAVLSQIYPKKDIKCTLLWTEGPKPMELSSKILDDILKNEIVTTHNAK